MKVAILGGGISGLSAAWYIKKRFQDSVTLTLFEKENRLGGWIQSKKTEGGLFEKGPRSFRPKGAGLTFLSLIKELGLENEVICGDNTSKERYLYHRKKLRKLPKNGLEFIFSPWMWKLIFPLLSEWNKPVESSLDESIHSFFSRRISPFFADTFADCLVKGIYAGDSHKLSISSCFPSVKEMEKKYGSLTKALLFHKREKRKETDPFFIETEKSSLFSFKGGAETIVDALASKLKESVVCATPVTDLSFREHGVFVNGEGPFDHVVSALPSYSLEKITAPHDLILSRALGSIQYESVAVVNLSYKKQVLPCKGFGYLVPTKEKEDILGVVFDSTVFPEQNSFSTDTRLTVMIGKKGLPNFDCYNESDFLEIAKQALAKHLSITFSPSMFDVSIMQRAIPQYHVGHEKKVKEIELRLRSLSNRIHLTGNSFYGVSVNDCVSRGKDLSTSGYFGIIKV